MNEIQRAYIAGLIDGEGSIGLWKQKRAVNRCGFGFVPSVSIANTSIELLEHARMMIGYGRIDRCSRKEEGHKQGYKLVFKPNDMRRLLPELVEYLFLKRPQAELLLRHLGIVKANQNYNSNNFPVFLQTYDRLKELNRRGVAGA